MHKYCAYKMKNNWKSIAIIFIILFGLLLAYNLWAIGYVLSEEKKVNECFYDICEYYPDAEYDDNLCTCYDYDTFGDLIVAKQKYMKK